MGPIPSSSGPKPAKTMSFYTSQSDPITHVKFSPDGSLLACGTSNGRLMSWNPTTGEVWKRIEAFGAATTSLDFSLDSSLLLSGHRDGTLNILDSKPLLLVRSFQGPTLGCFVGESQMVAGGNSERGRVTLWDIATGACVFNIPGHSDNIVCMEVDSLDHEALVSSSIDKNASVYDVKVGKRTHVLEGHTATVTMAKFFPGQKAILASCSLDYTVRLWDCRTCLTTAAVLLGHTKSVHRLAISPDAALVASASYDTTVRIWDVRQRKCLHSLEGHKCLIDSVWFVGPKVVSAARDGEVRIWDSAQGTCLEQWQQHTSVLRCADLSSIHSLASAGDGDSVVVREI